MCPPLAILTMHLTHRLSAAQWDRALTANDKRTSISEPCQQARRNILTWSGRVDLLGVHEQPIHATQQNSIMNDRYESLSTEIRRPRYVRLCPHRRRETGRSQQSKRAKLRHVQRSRIGEALKRREGRHGLRSRRSQISMSRLISASS